MSHAQKILVASYAMLCRILDAGITVEPEVLQEFYRRVERWCAEAQAQEPASTTGQTGGVA